MNYIVFDLEFNQLYTKKNTESSDSAKESSKDNSAGISLCQSDAAEKINISKSKKSEDAEVIRSQEIPFEIIQIGAVKLDENLEIISTFNKYVKPSLYKEIHPFIHELTGISTDMLNDKELFPCVYNEFMKFIGHDDFVMCVWGLDDIKQLLKNIHFHELNSNNNLKRYIDIQSMASKEFNTPKGNRLGLKTAVEYWNIPVENDFHNAINDAVYTAHIFRKVYKDDIKPRMYSNPNYSRTSKPSLKVDTEKLIAQFEKMFNRK